ncbi:MAG: hypothetical protein F4X11_15470 [Acidobacteria bacterium]|nr:hypothetical protein [Acidobacteriota bacterium]
MTAAQPERPDTEDRGYASRVERWFLRAMLGVSIVAWSALLLAELGLLRLGLLAFMLAVAVIGFGLWGSLRAAPPAPPASGGGWRPALAAAAGILVCAALFLPPYHTEMAAGDATVYLNFSRQIARHGALEFEDPLVRRLPADSRGALFLNRVPGDVVWTVRVALDGRPYSRFPGGFLIPDIADPTVTTGFSPLFPVLTALGHTLVSPQGALVVAPLFATLSLIGLWCVARRLGGVPAAWLAAALTAVSMPQIWFAKVPLPETVAQCFVVAGVLAWLVATARGAPRWACAAGWFLGLACFAKVDLVVLLSVFLLAVAAVRLLGRARPDDPPLLLPLLGTFGLLMAHNLVHYLTFDSHYRPYVAYLMRTSEVLGLLRESFLLQAGVALATGVLVAAGVVGLRRPEERWVRRLWGLAAAGGLVVYGAAYVTATTGRLDETISWLGWYFSWPVLGLAGLGLAVSGLAGLGLVRRAAPAGLVFAGLLLGVVGLQYLYDPLETGVQIGSMRRFVPVVLPLTMLFAALAAVGLLARVPAPRYRVGLTLAAGALLVGLVARPSLALIGQPLWDDSLAPVARLFPERAVVLMSPDLAGTHIPTSLAYLHDVDTILVQGPGPDGRVLRRVIGDWLAGGRAVFFVVGRDDFSFFAPDLALAAIGRTQIDLRTLEVTRARVPQAVVRTPILLRFFQVTGTADGERLDVDVGTPAVDLLYDLRGFHASEPERGPTRRTFRWTGPRASLRLPAASAVTLVAAGPRPPGVAPAEITVSVGERVLGRWTLAGTPQAVRMDLPETGGPGPIELEIESTTFRPEAFGSSPDRRDLGVRLYRVLVDPPPAEPAP